MTEVLTAIVLGINGVTFVTFGVDKWKARRARSRVRERTLLLLALLGGAAGAWVGMFCFRHKTRKRSFLARMLLASALNVLWVWLWLRSQS